MAITGLSEEEVAVLKSQGKTNKVRIESSRSYGKIVVNNLITPFNLLLFTLGAILLLLGETMNALSAVLFITLNILISSFQEIRAKRILDRITVLSIPKATVLRDGKEKEVDPSEIVLGDVIILRPGEQASVDGELLQADHLGMDESLLTGESRTVVKKIGDKIYSGCNCITGEGLYKATAFGEDSMAFSITKIAKGYRNKYTRLQFETASVMRVLMVISIVFMVIVALIRAFIFRGTVHDISALVNSAVIVVYMVPMALSLFVTVSYMVAAVRMSGSGVLLQRFNSVESMSHVDTVCLDKTGTITTNGLVFDREESFCSDSDDLLRRYLGAIGVTNRTTEAMIEHLGKIDTESSDEIPFSSERMMSAVRIGYEGQDVSLFLGAPSVFTDHMDRDVSQYVHDYSDLGLRTLVFAKGYTGLDEGPSSLECISVIGLRDELRINCKMTMQTLADDGIDVRVISGDDPRMIESLFRGADIQIRAGTVSGDELDGLIGPEKEEMILNTGIFGRMRPEQKGEVISVLRSAGRYVAMIGDGINDVPALKNANVGISLNSGSNAAKGSADLLMMNDDFGVLPKAISEGERTIAGMKDSLKIFLTKNVTIASLVLFLMIGFSIATGTGAIPFLPTQQMIYDLLTATVTPFVVMIWARSVKGDREAIPSVMRYVIPTSVIAGLFGLVIYIIFYTMTLQHVFWPDITDVFLYRYGWPQFESFDDMMAYYGTDSLDARYAEINARCALVMFCIIEGIIHIFGLMPRSGRISAEGNVCTDRRPRIVAAIMLLLAAAFYAASIDGIITDVFPMVRFTVQESAIIIIFSLICFAVNIMVLRSGRMDFIARYLRKHYHDAYMKVSNGDKDP